MTDFVADHGVFLLIFEDALENGECSSVVDLSKAVRQFVTQQRRSAVESFIHSSGPYATKERGVERTFTDNFDRFD